MLMNNRFEVLWEDECDTDNTLIVTIKKNAYESATFRCEKIEDYLSGYLVKATCLGGEDCPYCKGYELEFEIAKGSSIAEALEEGIERAIEDDERYTSSRC